MATAVDGEEAAAPEQRPARSLRDDLVTLAVGVVAAASAFGAGLAGCAPVGVRSTDVVLTALAAAGLTALGARASALALVVAGGVATVAGQELPLRLAGGVAVALALVLLVARRPGLGRIGPVLGAASTAVATQVLLRQPWEAPVRGSAAVAALALVPVAWSGLRHTSAPTRRLVRRGAGLAGALVVVAGLAGVGAALLAGTALRDGVRGIDDGLDAVRDGDQDAALAELDAAAIDLREARDRTRAWWAAPARHLPVVAQQLAGLDAVADGGARTATAAADGARRIDGDRLRLVDGRLDPAAVADAEPVLEDLAARLGDLRAELAADDPTSPWLLPPVARGVDRFTEAVADAEGSAETGLLAARVGPELLGADGEATYLVAFVSPSEARGTGFLGNYGVLRVRDGRLDLDVVGRNKDLNAAGDGDRTISGPPDYLARYGPFDPQSTWENVTFTPDGPTAARVMAELLPQSGGPEVDGVIRIDPAGLARLLRITGSVEVEGLPYPLDARNVTEFLQVGQYRLFDVREARIDLLGRVAEATFAALTTGDGPAPARLARVLGPAARGGHVSLWLRDPEAQDLVERLGATAAVPPVRGDGFGVVTQNAGGGKIDAFLQRTVRYEATVDARTGEVRATAEIGLRNDAPSSGEPPYLIGNLVGAPPGTNRTWLSAYSPLALEGATLDGRPVELDPGRELGRNAWSTFVDIPPGESVNLTLELSGALDLSDGTYRFDWLPQVMVNPDRVDVVVRVEGGTLRARDAAPAPTDGITEADGEVRAGAGAVDGTFTVVARVRREGG